jgi:hypothetical protein
MHKSQYRRAEDINTYHKNKPHGAPCQTDIFRVLLNEDIQYSPIKHDSCAQAPQPFLHFILARFYFITFLRFENRDLHVSDRNTGVMKGVGRVKNGGLIGRGEFCRYVL